MMSSIFGQESISMSVMNIPRSRTGYAYFKPAQAYAQSGLLEA